MLVFQCFNVCVCVCVCKERIKTKNVSHNRDAHTACSITTLRKESRMEEEEEEERRAPTGEDPNENQVMHVRTCVEEWRDKDRDRERERERESIR